MKCKRYNCEFCEFSEKELDEMRTFKPLNLEELKKLWNNMEPITEKKE